MRGLREVDITLLDDFRCSELRGDETILNQPAKLLEHKELSRTQVLVGDIGAYVIGKTAISTGTGSFRFSQLHRLRYLRPGLVSLRALCALATSRVD